MKSITSFIIKKRVYILVTLVILLALSVIGFLNTGVNSDVTSYLPDDTMTSIGKEKLAEIFGIKGDANLGVSNIKKDDLAKMVDYISTEYTYVDVNGETKSIFNQVAWLGSFDPLKKMIDESDDPNGMVNTSLKETYRIAKAKFYKEDTDTYIIFMYLAITNSDDVTMNALTAMDTYFKETGVKFSTEYGTAGTENAVEFMIGGGAANAKNLLESSIGEIPKYLVIAVIFIFLVLLITTKSYIEPFIFLITLGISIVLNLGTNIILGEISSITLSSSTILQLALAMDFSIFLMHSYYEERKKTLDAKSALDIAVPKTLKAISASALTTIGGFVALFSMEFGMGLDLGAVLAKGVFLSLLTVVILQPILIFIFEKQIKRTQHRFFEPRIKHITKFSCKRKTWIVAIAIIVAIPTFIIQLLYVPLNYLTITEPIKDPNPTEIQVNQVNGQIICIVPFSVTNGKKDLDPHYNFIKKLNQIRYEDKKTIREVFSIFTMLDKLTYTSAENREPAALKMLEDNFLRVTKRDPVTNLPTQYYALYTVELDTKVAPIESKATYSTLDQIAAHAKTIFGDENKVYVTGNSQGAKDLNHVTPVDFIKVSVLSALIIFVILVLTFKSFILSLLLLLAIQIGIWINLALVPLGGPINFMSYIIISSIQLGATVDYAILFTSKYLESRKSLSVKDALRDAMYRGSPSILVSASVLIIACLSVYAVTTNVIVSQITMLVARGALLSTLLVMILLPALIYMVYKRKDTIPDLETDVLEIYKKQKKPAIVISGDATENINNVVRGIRTRKIRRIQDDEAAIDFQGKEDMKVAAMDAEVNGILRSMDGTVEEPQSEIVDIAQNESQPEIIDMTQDKPETAEEDTTDHAMDSEIDDILKKMDSDKK